MVTRSVIRISSEEKAAFDANAKNHHENDQLLEDERKCLGDAKNDGGIDPINFSGELDCSDSLTLPLSPTLPPLSPNDAEVAQGTSLEITQQDNDKKRRRDAQNGRDKKKHKSLDLSDVPEQPPIKKEKEGSSSQYKGVYFNKAMNKWRARIYVDGKHHYIGAYDNEEEAATDYARAVSKYKEGNANGGCQQRGKLIDLADVPAQTPIKSDKKGKSSQYKGVYFHKEKNKWVTRIRIDGKQRAIGYYDDEEEAAIDYARAVFKYKKSNAEDSSWQNKLIDLADVPNQLPIKSERKGSSSQYKGVTFDKARKRKKWVAQIRVDGKQHNIGCYDNEEEAGSVYARAVFKYKKRNAEDNSRQRKREKIDLTDVPKQLPIKSEKKGKSSQYKGVTFNKAKNRWVASITVDGKTHNIGYYSDEEEAAIDYATAVFKYKGSNTEDSSRQNKLIDLADVPKQPPIRSERKGSSSQYKGVTFDKARKKWRALIMIDGKKHTIGYYGDEEEAAVGYATAVVKYKEGNTVVSCRQRKKLIDLTDVPKQLPIKSDKKGSSSQYKGVTFDKARKRKKWVAQIRVDGKQHNIGYYDNEKEAAIDYARAVFKYKKGNQKDP